MPILTLPPGGIPLSEIEKMAIVQALERCHWMLDDTANFLGISLHVLRYKIQRHWITLPSGHRYARPLLGKHRGNNQSTLTQADVASIRADADALQGSPTEKAKAIASRAKGLFGPWQRIRAILTGEHPHRR